MVRRIKDSMLALLVARIMLLTLVFTFVIGALIYVQIDKTLVQLRDRTLEDRAQDIASYMTRDDDGKMHVNIPRSIRNLYAESGKYHQYVVRDDDGEVLLTSPIAYSESYPRQYHGARVFEFQGPQGTKFLGVGFQHEYDGEKYLVQVVESLETAEAFSKFLSTDFLSRVSMIALPFVFALLLVTYFSLRQSLRPLVAISGQAKNISFQRPELRLEEQALPQEIKPLVEAVNGALQRLEHGIMVQREFTANVAHELRTPLTVLKARVEALKDKKSAAILGEDIEDMIRTVNQMLDLSKLDFPEAVEMEPVDLGRLVKAVCQDIWPLFIAQGRDLSVTGADGDITMTANKDLLYRALRNLLENALKYSPAKTPVLVAVNNDNISVRDYGQPIPERDRQKIFRRFNRTDREKLSNGAGLGLSIVSKIVKIHGGTIRLEAAADGENGNVFVMDFSIPQREADK